MPIIKNEWSSQFHHFAESFPKGTRTFSMAEGHDCNDSFFFHETLSNCGIPSCIPLSVLKRRIGNMTNAFLFRLSRVKTQKLISTECKWKKTLGKMQYLYLSTCSRGFTQRDLFSILDANSTVQRGARVAFELPCWSFLCRGVRQARKFYRKSFASGKLIPRRSV